LPTAVQAFGDVQDTPDSKLLVEPLGAGTAWTRQLVPFQDSARFTLVSGVLPGVLPTAVQAVADGQDTPTKPPLLAPVGSTVRWIRQRVPFHLSARGNPVLDRLAACEPTAVQARPDVHETADSSLMPVAFRFWFGVGSTFHPLPAAVPAWLACAGPAVTAHVQPSSKVRTPSGRTACAKRTLLCLT
jgi:hypothetical protein